MSATESSVVVVITAVPEPEHRAEVIAAFEKAIDRVHDEPGVEVYALHEGPERLVMIEKYESEQTRVAHTKRAALAELLSELQGKLRQPLESHVLSPHPAGKREMGLISGPRRAESQRRLLGQTVVVIGGSAGIGLETARQARAEGANLVLAGRNAERLQRSASELEVSNTAAFDANDLSALQEFFTRLDGPIDHVMVTAGGPYYATLADMDFDEGRRALQEHPMLMAGVAKYAAGKVRPGGTLIFMGGVAGRNPALGVGLVSAMTAALPALTASLAREIAPVRINLIAAGFVDTPLSASLLGEDLERRRAELREKLPIGRVVEPADVAALAIHIMSNTALTGATYDIDGGQQLVSW